MRWMIPGSKLLLDQHSHPHRGLDLAVKPRMLGSFSQQVRQPGSLFLSQFGWWTRRRVVAQRIRTIFLRSAHPLTHHAFGDFQGLGDFFLFPALLVQLPGTQSSAFAPIFRKEFFLAHTSFHRLAKFITLDPHAEVNNRNGIRGWYNRAGGGVSFLLIKTQTPQEATALLQLSRGLMRCAVRAAPTLDDEQQIQPLRHVSQQTGSSTGCPSTRGDPARLSPGSFALGGDCLARSSAPCSTSKLLCPRLSTPVREEKSYA
jgi:hypothetical protein